MKPEGDRNPDALFEKMVLRVRTLYEKSLRYQASEPEMALMQARKAAEAICKQIYRREKLDKDGKPASAMMLDALLNVLTHKGHLPKPIEVAFRTIQQFGNLGAHAHGPDSEAITGDYVRPCLQALGTVVNWYFGKYHGHDQAIPPASAAKADDDDDFLDVGAATASSRAAVDQYEQAVLDALRDLKIDAKEKQQLVTLRKKLRLSRETASTIFERALNARRAQTPQPNPAKPRQGTPAHSARDDLGGAEAEEVALEDCVVSDARDDDDMIAQLADVTGLSVAGVRKRLNKAHGRTRVVNLFNDRWPDDPPDLRTCTVAEARDSEELIAQLAELTTLRPGIVKRRLNKAHGAQHLVNCFWEHWPDAAPLDDLSVVDVRDSEERILELAELTGLTKVGVKRRLNRSHGAMRLRNCFSDCWPERKDDLDKATVAEAREDGALVLRIAELVGMTRAGVRRRLNKAHGTMRVANCFADRWPD